MTVETESRQVIHQGNGAATVFPFQFPIPDPAYAVVSLQDWTTKEIVATLLPSQYSISGAVPGSVSGSVTYPLSGAPLTNAYGLIIERTVPYVQTADLLNQGGFYPETIEGALDLTEMQIQQIASRVARAIVVPQGEVGMQISGPLARANKFFSFDADGNFFPSSGMGVDSNLRDDLGSQVAPGGAGIVTFVRDAVGVVPRSLAHFKGQTVHITEFGAEFDVGDVASIGDATDDTAAWQAALAHLVTIGGGTLVLPPGASKVTAVIDIPLTVPIRIVGTGRRKVYPGQYVVGQKVPSTVVPVHSGRCTFRFPPVADGNGGFYGAEFNIATLETGSMPECGFGFETQNGFFYGAEFYRVGVYGFKSAGGLAWEAYRVGGSGETAIGAIVIDCCAAHRNNGIFHTSGPTAINVISITSSLLGQNGMNPGFTGINIAGHCVAIIGNIIESNRDAVKVYGAYRACTIRNNYFELNPGTALINVADIRSYDIGPNYFGPQDYGTLDHNVLMNATGLGRCVDPAWPQLMHKPFPLLTGNNAENRLNNAVTGYGLCRLDQFAGLNWSQFPDFLTLAANRVSISQKGFNPQTGKSIPVQEYTTTGTGIISMTSTLNGNIGEWVVACTAFRRVPDAGAIVDPFVTMNINNTGGAGTRDFALFNYTTHWVDGDWVLVTTAVKLGVAMTSLGLYLYPFGISPAAGRVAQHLRPFVYTVDNINKYKPFLYNFIAESVAAAPTVGTWSAGDMLMKPTGGYFACTVSGTPGTWLSINPA